MPSPFIPYGRQDVSDADIDAVVAVLKGDMLTTGPTIGAFEHAYAQRVGAQDAVAMNSATSALHVAYLALGIGPGDWVWTCPNTFVATANAALYCGGKVDFVDVEPGTGLMSITGLRAKLESCPLDRRPKLVVPVHFAGQCCDMVAIAQLAAEFGFKLVEDASHAVGADYDGAPVGACRYSDISVFSFHPVKIITSGEGGMATTNDPVLAERMRSLRSHGITRDAAQMREPSHGPWYYEQLDLGFNYRLTDIQAALGLSQLGRLDSFIARRRQLVAGYDQAFADGPVIPPSRAANGEPSWHLYCVSVPAQRRSQIFDGLRAEALGVQVLYIPVHLQPYYRDLGFHSGDFPVAEEHYATTFALPMFAALTDAQQARVVATVRQVCDAAG